MILCGALLFGASYMKMGVHGAGARRRAVAVTRPYTELSMNKNPYTEREQAAWQRSPALTLSPYRNQRKCFCMLRRLYENEERIDQVCATTLRRWRALTLSYKMNTTLHRA